MSHWPALNNQPPPGFKGHWNPHWPALSKLPPPEPVELSGTITATASVSGRLTVLAYPDRQIVIDGWDGGELKASMWRYEQGRAVDWDGDLEE